MRARKLNGQEETTGEWVSRVWGRPKSSAQATDRRARREDIRDLRRVPGPEARKFRHENPGADIHDWASYQQHGGKGRYQGKD